MSWTGDALKDWERYDAQQQRGLDKLPKCSYCHHPIQDDDYYEFEDRLLCPECLNEHHKKSVEDYIQDHDW